MDKFVVRTPREPFVAPRTEEPRYRQLVIESLRKVTNISQVKRWANQLDQPDCSLEEQLHILEELDQVFMSREVLTKSNIGLCVNRLRKRALTCSKQDNQEESSDSSSDSDSVTNELVAKRAAALVKKWREGFQLEQLKEEICAKKEPPMFLLGSKGRNRTYQVFYQRLIGGLSNSMERDEAALKTARKLENILAKRHGEATVEYSTHARLLLHHISDNREELRKGTLSPEDFMASVMFPPPPPE